MLVQLVGTVLFHHRSLKNFTDFFSIAFEHCGLVRNANSIEVGIRIESLRHGIFEEF